MAESKHEPRCARKNQKNNELIQKDSLKASKICLHRLFYWCYTQVLALQSKKWISEKFPLLTYSSLPGNVPKGLCDTTNYQMCHEYLLLKVLSLFYFTKIKGKYLVLGILFKGMHSFDSSLSGLLRKRMCDQVKNKGQRSSAKEEFKQHTGFQ